MKKNINLLAGVAMLCLIFMVSAFGQAVNITYPVNGSVIQRQSDNRANVSFCGTIGYGLDSTSLYNYKLVLIGLDLNTGEPNNVNNAYWDIDLVKIAGVDYGVFRLFINIPSGWYSAHIAISYKNGFAVGNYTQRNFKIGVGDTFIIAGQSNARGFPYVWDKGLIGYDNTLNDSQLPDAVRVIGIGEKDMIKSSDALTEQETMKPGGGIPFLRGFEKLTLKKELNTVNLSYPDEFGNQKPIYSRPIFPVGTDSWCWAPLGKKYVAAQNVPVQFFNVAIDGSSITNWQAGTPNYNRLLNLLKRQANIVGHRGILWHQGEADASQSMSGATYQSYLKSMVDNIQSAFDPSGSTWGPLTWNISKVSYHTKYNPPNFDVFDNSTINPNSGIRNAQSNVSFASSIKKPGIDTDGILASGRGPFQKIHFHGATHNTVGEMWKNAGLWNNTPKEAMGSIARLTYEKLSDGNIRLKVIQDYPIAEFKWVKNEDGIEDNVGNTDTYDVPRFSSTKVFYTCFVRPTDKNYYLITAPFIGPNEEDKNPKIEIIGSTNQINLSGSQQTKVAEIYSQNMTWTSTITGGSGWLSIIENPSGSFGSTNVKIQTLTNSGSNVRNAIITFNGVGPLGETMSKSLVISQSGSASGTVSLLTLSPSSGSFNTNLSNDMNTMQIGGVQYFQGLGVHADRTITYNLGGQYSTFFGKVGRDDEADNAYDSGKVQFVIKADGAVIWTSQVHGNNTSAEAFNVNISGKNNLELIVNQLEDMNFDHADWVDLYLTTSGGSGCSTPTNPSNVSASASSITSGQSTTLSASCSVGTITWSTGQTGASVSVSPTATTTYQVSCVNGSCQSGTVPVSITVIPSGGGGACSAVSNNLTMGTWTVTGQPLVARYFHGQYWLTQKVSSSPDEFVVRGAAMLQRSDVSLSNSANYNLINCFSWIYSDYGNLQVPNSSTFPTPAGYTLVYSQDGTPYYSASGAPPSGIVSGNCYKIRSLANNNYVQAMSNGEVQINGNNNQNDQKWKVESVGTSYKVTTMNGSGQVIKANSLSYSSGLVLGNFVSGNNYYYWNFENNAGNYRVSAPSNQYTWDHEGAGSGNHLQIYGTTSEQFIDYRLFAFEGTTCPAGLRVAAETGATEEEKTGYMNFAPNPTSGAVEVKVNLVENGEVNVSLTDFMGRELESKNYQGSKGTNSFDFKASNLPAGVYLLRVKSKGKIESKKIIIE